ncbi:hypothetical protein GCM10018771_69370 [Streptomyces cellulosae]|nr:hypothetical protein GCM10018771_69370 [Streptomyces cellulosae]
MPRPYRPQLLAALAGDRTPTARHCRIKGRNLPFTTTATASCTRKPSTWDTTDDVPLAKEPTEQ